MDHQTLLMRRLVAAGGVIVVVILLVFLVKSCADSRREQALKDYNRNVRSLVEQSKNSGDQLFSALSGASGQQATQLQETINQLRGTTDEALAQAERLDTPDAMKEAQADLELLLSLRRDGVTTIADLIQKAVGGSAGAGAAVDEIAGQMQAFNASDVIYSQRVAPLILRGLKDDGISASYDGTAGEQVLQEADFLKSLGWMSPAYVATQLGATSSSNANGTPAPGLHGHQLDSVVVGDTTLVAAPGSNQLDANPPPTFVVTFTNGGENNETNVKVTVEITGGGAPVKADAIVANTTAGAQATANVQLTKAPPTSGPVSIKVTVGKVPGEEKLDNNTQTYAALFS